MTTVSVAMGRRSTGRSLSTTSTPRRVKAKSEARVWFASLSSTPTSAAYSFALSYRDEFNNPPTTATNAPVTFSSGEAFTKVAMSVELAGLTVATFTPAKQAQFRTEQMRRERALEAIWEGWRLFAPRRAALRLERQKKTIAQNESYFDAMRNRLEDAAVRLLGCRHDM